MSSLRVSTLNVVMYKSDYKLLPIFIDADMRIKGVLITDHEMKILNFPDDTTIFFLRDINWNTRIKSILKLHEKSSSSKTNCSKITVLWAGVYKNRIDKPEQMIWSQLYIKLLEVLFVNFVLNNNNWDWDK